MRDTVADLVRDYYALMREILREAPGLARCLVRCQHCGILFFADPRNAGRQDLGCPFGCSEAHRKRESARRSAAYYREPEGKEKKRRLNQRRHRVPPASAANGKQSAVAPTSQIGSKLGSENAELPPAIFEYVRLVGGFIEGRALSQQEVEELYSQIVRQRSMARRRELDHLIAELHKNPP